MKSITYCSYVLLISLSLVLAISACKHTTDPDPQSSAMTITSIDPATAPVGSTIAVNGTNFSTNPASSTVLIGGIQATIVSATATKIVVTVPDGATTGATIAVIAGGQTAQSGTVLTVSVKPLKPVVEVQGEIRDNLTWTKDNIYLLKGIVYLTTDHTLTIEPGTVIKGASAAQDPTGKGFAGTLVVELRGKLYATGTVKEPIVFTSVKPAGQRTYGDWGGIVFVGKSPKNRPATTLFAGGIRGMSETYYEPEDNSGTLQYVRIEFAGTPRPAVLTDRLNGLTLYGVGNGTVIDHIQVSYSSNDAFAWYGGSVNMKNLVAYRSYNEDWYTDWGYVGKVQFGVALRDPTVADASGVNSIESQNFDPGENADGTPLTKQNGAPQTAPIFANLSSFAFSTTPLTTAAAQGGGAYQAGIYLRRNTAISIYNSLIYGYPEGLHIDGTATGTLANLTSGSLDLKGIVLANTLLPIVGSGAITTAQATSYFTANGRVNQVIASTDLSSLLLNVTTFSPTAPNFLPASGSPLLSGAVMTGKVADSFFTPVTYRGAFGEDNWLAGWTNFNPQQTDYDR